MAVLAASIMGKSLLTHPHDLVKEPLFTCCPASFLGTDIYAAVIGVEHPHDLVKEPQFTCCPADFLGTDIYETISVGEQEEELKQFVKEPIKHDHTEEPTKILQKTSETVTSVGKQELKQIMKNRKKHEHTDESTKILQKTCEDATCDDNDSIALNRRIDKFRRRRERSKQLKKREHDKKLYDAKKLAAKLARTI